MKKYLLGLFAIALAVGFSAFTQKHSSKKFQNVWYIYNGGGQNDASKYTQAPDPSDPGCFSGNVLCSVLLPDNGTNPDATDLSNIQSDINSAVSSQTPSSDVVLKTN